MAAYEFKIAAWNANGLSQHAEEVKTYIKNQNIDIMLISETHFTNKNFLTVPKYKIYHTPHPDGNAHGGTALIIRDSIKHQEMDKYVKEHLQATIVQIDTNKGNLTVAAIYCPPKHNNKQEHFEQFFKTLGNKFIAGGDYNAKHSMWGSRLITTKGRELAKVLLCNNLRHISTGEPTYWPSDRAKTPDLIDFYITKGIDTKRTKIESCLDLSSDHTPIILYIFLEIVKNVKRPTLTSKKTNWDLFRKKLDDLIPSDVPLKTDNDIENAVQTLTTCIQQAAWYATPDALETHINEELPITIKQKIMEKRKIRKQWQRTRCETNKTKLNKVTKELKELLSESKNQRIQNFLTNLDGTEATDYSLWKATRKIKRPQQTYPPVKDKNNKWVKSNQEKANAFADHLLDTFQPNPTNETDEENEIEDFLTAPLQMDLPIKKCTVSEIETIIQKYINPTKAPGFDLITGKVLQEATKVCYRTITQIFNAIIRICHFPSQWKVAEVVMIPKPGKKPEDIKSYRPISLLPILSKVFEKLLQKRLNPVIEERKLLPNHQFGFRCKHGTIEQVHRVVNKINRDMEHKRYCSAAFLDVSQAFDKVWHTGLMYKLKKNLPAQYYLILKSYISNRYFYVKQEGTYTRLYPINAGVPQGSVLGPILYLLFTADLPTTRTTMTATFADDTAVLASHTDPFSASRNLQINLNKIENWLKKWRINVNKSKSVQVTFTARRETCPPVTLNNEPIPQANDAKYLGIHLDRRLTWKKHIFTKRKQLGLKFSQMYWLMGRRSQMSIENKVLLYKTIIKPIWTYGIQLWGSAAESNLEILQRFQNKVLRVIVNAPRYMPNRMIQQDIPIPSIKEEIKNSSVKYRERMSVHPNTYANKLFDRDEVHRLKRFQPCHLVDRFN